MSELSSYIQAFALAQVHSLNQKTVKERLRFTIAGVKDGKFYNFAGTNYGDTDYDVPDTEFITEADMATDRITGAKITKIQNRMLEFFNEYGKYDVEMYSDGKAEEAEFEDTEIEDEPEVEDLDEGVVKKLIKKGKFKKAQKLIDEVGGHTKLQKKLDKAMKDA